MERGHRPLRVGERDQRVEGADLRPGRHRRREDLRPEGTAGVDHRLAAVHPERAGQRGDGIVGDGQDDQLDLVEDRLRVGECPVTPTSELNRSRRPASRLATAWTGQPARVSATPSAVPTAPAPTMPMTGGSPGPEWRWGWTWSLGVGLIAMTVRARRRRIEVDAGRLDGGFLLGALVRLILLRVVARQVAPGPHRRRGSRRISSDSIRRV